MRQERKKKKKGLEVKITSEKLPKKGFEGLFSTESLRWILRIPLRLKHSSRCGGSAASNGGSWWPPVVVGGGEEGVRVCVGICRGGE